MGGPAPRRDDDAEARYEALVALSALSGQYGVGPDDLPEPYRGRDVGADLRLVAEAPPDQIPVSARLALLYDLARAGYPEHGLIVEAYRQLATSAVRERTIGGEPVTAQELLDDIAAAAAERVPLSTRRSARAFAHFELAFIGRDVCTVQRVQVGGIRATWIYCEFETDASFASVADWVDPRRWSEWGPLFFRRMELVGGTDPPPLAAPPPGDPHWHGVFHEEVQLLRRLNTLLRCTYWQDGAGTAAMTYDLDLSLDGEIDVDRGYLLVTDTGTARRVQALKIVGFTTDVWDAVAGLVCPFWTDFVRGAVRDGTKVTTTTPTQTPGSGFSPAGQTVEAWIEYFGEAVQPYLELCTDASSRIRSGAYTSADVVADGTRWWSQFAKDWARAWTTWADTVGDVAREGLDAGFTPPGTPRERGRGTASALATPAAAEPGGTVVALAGLGPTDRPVCSDLVSIETGPATIPAQDVALTVERPEGGPPRVRLRTTSAAAPPGLYVGRLHTPAQQVLAPVQLYVSRAAAAGPP